MTTTTTTRTGDTLTSVSGVDALDCKTPRFIGIVNGAASLLSLEGVQAAHDLACRTDGDQGVYDAMHAIVGNRVVAVHMIDGGLITEDTDYRRSRTILVTSEHVGRRVRTQYVGEFGHTIDLRG